MACWAMENAYPLRGKMRVRMVSEPDKTSRKSPSMPVPRNFSTASLRVQMAVKSASGVPGPEAVPGGSRSPEDVPDACGVPGGSKSP